MKHHLFSYLHLAVLLLFGFLVDAWGGTSSAPAPASGSPIPPEILAIMQKPRYSHATWALRELVARFCLGVLQFDPLLLALALLTLAGART